MKELIEIQNELKSPKNQFNNFGNYKYRSCEDILEAVKPLANEKKCIILLSDEIIAVSDRVYVCATAEIRSEKDSVKVTAFAREALSQKGMSEAQITGSASSYARKYALNGLLAIDDTKDDDTKGQDTKDDGKKTLKDEHLQRLLKTGSVDELRALLNDFICTKIQEKAIITRGKELIKQKQK